MRKPIRPIRLSGPTSMISSGYPAFGTSRASMPRADPTKSTSLRGWRVFTSSPSARPGKRGPAVPAPATTSLIAPRPRPGGRSRPGRGGGGADPAPDDRRKEQQHRRDAREPQLLADDAEDEVGVRGGKEEQLLVAFSQSDAERPARPEREERLHGLVAVAPRVLPGIE